MVKEKSTKKGGEKDGRKNRQQPNMLCHYFVLFIYFLFFRFGYKDEWKRTKGWGTK